MEDEEALVGSAENVEEEVDQEPIQIESAKLPLLNRKKFIWMLIFIVLYIFIFVSTGTTIGVLVAVLPSDEIDEQPVTVRNTIEYQIQLTPDQRGNRNQVISNWFDTINSASSYLDLTYSLGNYSIRREYNVDPRPCGKDSYILRVREYTYYWKAGTATFDLKKSNKDRSTACAYPFTPVENVTSSEKCEEDMHKCDHKYARESRIYFDYYPTFERCKDVAKYFPDAFHLSTSQKNSYTGTSTIYGWYLFNYSGVLGNDTEYEISFTYRYSTEAIALSESKASDYAEMSIRISALNAGYSNSFNGDIKNDVQNVWHVLLDTYGTEDCGIVPY